MILFQISPIVVFFVYTIMSRNPYFHLVASAYRYAGVLRFRVVYTYGLFIIANALVATKPYILGQFFNILQTGGDIFVPAIIFLIIYSGIDILFWCFHGPARYLEWTTGFYIMRTQMEFLFDTVVCMPIAWHADHHSGDTINKIRKSTDALKRFSDGQFTYIETIIRFLGAIIGIAVVFPLFGVIAFFVSMAIFSVSFLFDRFLISLYEARNAWEHRVASVLYDYIGNIRTVITLRFEALAKSELVHRIADIFVPLHRQIVINEIKWFTVSLLIVCISFATILTYLVSAWHSGEVILIGSVVILFQYLDRLGTSFYAFAWQWGEIVSMDTDVRAVDPLLADVRRSEYPDVPKIPTDWRNIRISSLSFRYEDAEHIPHSLDNVSLDLVRGRCIALVGESGSGKSTLLSLIRGLYDVNYIHIEADGIVYNSLRSLAPLSTLVPQDPEIFENTLAYNIAFGLDKAPEELEWATDIARFSGVLDRLPKGLDTHIQEKGVNLSGGEKQRLALARGVLMARESSILLLDEPTSSVDPENELAIYRNIFETFRDQCIISSIHRLHLLPLFDYLYILEQWRIIESGTFSELISQEDGKFATIWRRFLANQNHNQTMSGFSPA